MSKEQPGCSSSFYLRQQKRDERRTNDRQQEEQRLIREDKRKSDTTKVYDIEVTEEDDNLCDTNWELKAVSQKK